MITKEEIQIARQKWLKASEDLNFRIITPYILTINGKDVEAFAYLPDYGSVKGALIGLYIPQQISGTKDGEWMDWARENGYFFSFINIYPLLEYTNEDFVEILEDWKIN